MNKERLWAISCYIPVINLVICLVCAVRMINSKLCRFHLSQGLVLFVLWILTIVAGLFSKKISLMLWGIVLLFHGVGAYFAFKGALSGIPVVSQIARNFDAIKIFESLTGKKPEDLDVNMGSDSDGPKK